jgi:hypothetical protein
VRPTGQKCEDEDVEVVVDGNVHDGGASHVKREGQPAQ